MVPDTRFALLGLLARSPGCGYDLALRFGELFGPDWRMSRGQIYGMLQTLEREGLVESTTTLRRRREIKHYRINEAGAQAFRQWRQEPCLDIPPHREALYLKLALAEPQDLPGLLACVVQREQSCVDRLRKYAEGAYPAPSGATAWQSVARDLIDRATTALLETELDWLETMKACLEEQVAALQGRQVAGEINSGGAVSQARRTA